MLENITKLMERVFLWWMPLKIKALDFERYWK